MVRKQLRKIAGYTLAEVMIVIAILGVVVLMGTPVMINSIRYFVLSRVKLELQREARTAMYVITRNIRQAQSSTIVIDHVAGQPYYSRVQFSVYNSTQTMTFYQSGTSLIQQVGANQTILSKNLQYLAFTFPRSDVMSMLSVSMTLQEATYSKQSKALHMASQKVQVMN